MLWLSLIGCGWNAEVRTECAPLNLSSGQPECDQISLCIETTRPAFASPERVSRRSWFQSPDGVGVRMASSKPCQNCGPSLWEVMCADVWPEQGLR